MIRIKQVVNWSQILPDMASSNLGYLIAPCTFFLKKQGILALLSAFLISTPILISAQYSRNAVFIVTAFFILLYPLFIISDRKLVIDRAGIYLYMAIMWATFFLFKFEASILNAVFPNQHGEIIGRFSGLSLEPSFFADTFFPIFLLALIFNDKILKIVSVLSLIVFIYFSGAKTFYQNIAIFILIYFFLAATKKNKIRVSAIYLVVIMVVMLVINSDFSLLDKPVKMTLTHFNSWRTLSNFAGIDQIKLISNPYSFSYDRLNDSLNYRYDGYSISAIFSALPTLIYTFGILPSIFWAYLILKKLSVSCYDNIFHEAIVISMIVIYFMMSPKWDFIYIITAVCVRNILLRTDDQNSRL